MIITILFSLSLLAFVLPAHAVVSTTSKCSDLVFTTGLSAKLCAYLHPGGIAPSVGFGYTYTASAGIPPPTFSVQALTTNHMLLANISYAFTASDWAIIDNGGVSGMVGLGGWFVTSIPVPGDRIVVEGQVNGVGVSSFDFSISGIAQV